MKIIRKKSNYLTISTLIHHNSVSLIEYIFLTLIIFFSFYFAIGIYPLFDNNEGLYASIGKYMLLQHDFIIPHLNCIPYIEKPPLLYWLLAGSFSLFGFKTCAARLITTTSATLICICLIWFAKKIKHANLGVVAALIFSSSIAIAIMARMVYFDMLFTLLISCSLYGLFSWYTTWNKTALRISYAFLGLAILTKGLVALIIIGGICIAFLWREKKLHMLPYIFDPKGIGLFLAIILPWHIAAALQHKGFLHHYIIEEHFLRFLSKREPHDYYHGPIYYYLPRLFIYLFPWSLFAPLLFWRPASSFKHADTNNISPIQEWQQSFMRFSWCWLLVPLLFFSLSNAKANYYMLVSAPALALILGNKILLLATKQPRIFCIYSTIILIISAIALACAYNYLPYHITLLAIIYATIAGIIVLFLQHQPKLILALLSALIIPCIGIMLTYVYTHKNELSTAEVGQHLAKYAQNKPLYLYQNFENFSALSFYAPSCFKMIDSQSNDLYYSKNLPQYKSWFITKEEIQTQPPSPNSYIIVPIDKLSQFYQDIKLPNPRMLHKWFRRVAIFKT